MTNSTGDAFRGNQTENFYVAGFQGFAYPDGLVPGTTYYWRIDETEADGAEFVDLNASLSWTPGYGVKLHTVYFGTDFDTVNNASGGLPQGTSSYDPGPLEPEIVYFWRVDEFDAIETHKGDIWSFTTPGAVGNPQPAYGTEDVPMNAILSWIPSDNAVSHELYFGTDQETVRHADSSSPEYIGPKTLGNESYDSGLLDAHTTYYWRVDEIDDQDNISKGSIWNFTIAPSILVEDFERYTDNDIDGEAIWQTWIDGFGVPDNGAPVGYLMPPYAEQRIVHGGSQSMSLLYTNDASVTNSEAAMTLTAPRY